MRPSDRTLQRWLRTGRPRRVERWLERPDVAERLEELTALRNDERAVLTEALGPVEGFEERVVEGAQRRLAGETVELLLDLSGLGWRTATALLDPGQSDPDPDDR